MYASVAEFLTSNLRLSTIQNTKKKTGSLYLMDSGPETLFPIRQINYHTVI